MAATWKKLAYEEDVVTKALFDAYSILAADVDNTPAAITLAASEMIGRQAAGGIVALAKADVLTILNVEDGADVTDADNVSAAGAIMNSLIAAKGDIIGASANDTPLILSVGADGKVLVADSGEATGLKWGDAAIHAASHKDGGSDEILLHEFGEPTSAVKFDGQQATDLVVHTVADSIARDALTPVVGKMVWQTDELAVYMCTVAA